MITVDIPEGKTLTITGPGQAILKTQTPDQVSLDDPAVEQVITVVKIEKK